jgi:hypothetical protein
VSEPEGIEEPLERWVEALRGLTATREAANAFRESRYRYAHAVAEQLTAGGHSDGHVVYGVQMPWGPLYVGQTKEGRRRLRDLVIGESHHLANTFPPETWHTVVVIRWPNLATAKPVVAEHGPDATGLALEHLLQERLQPLFNGHKRTRTGGWRATNYSASRSHAAELARMPVMSGLADEVVSLWSAAASGQELSDLNDSSCYALHMSSEAAPGTSR